MSPTADTAESPQKKCWQAASRKFQKSCRITSSSSWTIYICTITKNQFQSFIFPFSFCNLQSTRKIECQSSKIQIIFFRFCQLDIFLNSCFFIFISTSLILYWHWSKINDSIFSCWKLIVFFFMNKFWEIDILNDCVHDPGSNCEMQKPNLT